MALLHGPARVDVGEIDERPVELEGERREHVPAPPGHGDGRDGHVLGPLGPVAGHEALDRGQIRPEVAEHLAQARLRLLGAVERAEAAVEIVEAVVVGVELPGGVAERVLRVPDAPEAAGEDAHAWKLATWRAARTTAANCALSVAAPRTSTGAWSSSRVLMPNSQARAVLPS